MRKLISGFIIFGIIIFSYIDVNRANYAKNFILPTPTPIIIQYPNGQILSLFVNNWRSSNNLQTFTSNETLCDIANQRAIDIQTDWSHDKFIPDVQPLVNKYNAYFGENLAKGYYSEQEILNDWIASPEHLVNLKNPTYTHMCIICIQDYCAQEFSSNF